MVTLVTQEHRVIPATLVTPAHPATAVILDRALAVTLATLVSPLVATQAILVLAPVA